MQELDQLDAGSVRGAIEAMLLASSDPVSATDLASILGIAPGEASEALADLAAEYSDANRGFQLREVAGGWRLFTHPAFHDQVEALVMSWDTRRLSQAALETLAVIAYHQPVTREGVKAIRGVNSDGVISSLVDKGLVREAGRDPRRAQAIRYATTQSFLEKFGLKSLRELPDLEQFAPDEESKKFIRERLSGRSIEPTLEEAAADIDEERELIDPFEDELELGPGSATNEAGFGDESSSGPADANEPQVDESLSNAEPFEAEPSDGRSETEAPEDDDAE